MKPTYEELEKKCALQQSKLAAINELMGVVEKASDIAKAGIEELQSQNADLAVQLANAESKCRELAAENGALKVAIDEHSQGFTVCNCCGTENDCSHDDVCRVLNETPATDAFLADVRAQGVELAADIVQECRDNICPGGLAENRQHEQAIVHPHLDAIADELDELVANLRKGTAA